MKEFLNEVLNSVDVPEFLYMVWTMFLLPVLSLAAKEINEWAKTKRIDKYTTLLFDAVSVAVKDVYQTVVQDIKGTDEWTDEKKAEVLELAKTKVIFSLSNSAYTLLKEVNEDFDNWVCSLIEAKLFELKNTK